MNESNRPFTRATPESVWKSIDEKEGTNMDIILTPNQLCVMARAREKESVWAYHILAVLLIAFAAIFAYNVFWITQPLVRLGQIWMAGVFIFFWWKLIRLGPRRMSVSESCASFLEREFEGKRRMLLATRQGIFLFVPAILASWWGGGPTLRLRALGVDPSSPRFLFASGPGPFIIIAAVLLFVWFSFGRAAKKATRELEELRRRTQE